MATRDLEEGWESLLGLVGDAQDEGDGAWGGRVGESQCRPCVFPPKNLK